MIIVNQFGDDNFKSYSRYPVTAILLGGIVENEDWRKATLEHLENLCRLENQSSFSRELVIYNPAKIDSNTKQPTYKDDEFLSKQINWDYHKMNNANIKAIYFANNSSQSLSMFELGYLVGTYEINNLIISISEGFRRNTELTKYLDSINTINHREIN